jgi:hydroxyacylglutathione hydrolase
VLAYDQKLLLVTERKEDVDVAKAYLCRLGFDNIAGFLCPGIREWRSRGKPFESLGVLSAKELRQKLRHRKIFPLDVREPSEWHDGHIEGFENVYVGHLTEEADRLPRERPLAVTCEWGGRGGLAASILRKMGFIEVYNVLGGVEAWRELGYAVKSE